MVSLVGDIFMPFLRACSVQGQAVAYFFIIPNIVVGKGVSILKEGIALSRNTKSVTIEISEVTCSVASVLSSSL